MFEPKLLVLSHSFRSMTEKVAFSSHFPLFDLPTVPVYNSETIFPNFLFSGERVCWGEML